MLVGWLTKAAAVFKKPEAVPQPFEIACECGSSVTGLRTLLQQKIGCPHCGRPIWVLPANVYPQISSARKSPAKARVTNSATQEEPPVERPRRRSNHIAQDKSKDAPAKDVAKVQNAPSPRETSPAPSAKPTETLSPGQIAARRRQRMFRLVVITMVALVAVTGWSLWHRQRVDHARRSFPQAAESGLLALKEGNFAEADRQLAAAVRGLDLVRQHDSWSETIRRAAREANAAHNLSPLSIIDLAQEASSENGTTEERRRQFQARHGGKWMLWDVDVVQKKSDSTASVFELDAPFSLDERPLHVTCSFAELRQVAGEATSLTAQRVIFAAQIDHWDAPEDAAQPLVAVLNSATAFVWTNYDSYRATGFRPVDAEDEQKTRDLLTRQTSEVLP